MNESQFWTNQGIRRILIIIFVLYSILMFIPIEDWPNDKIRNQVELKHCSGVEEHMDDLRKKYEEYNKRFPDPTRDVYDSIREDNYHKRDAEIHFRTELKTRQWLWFLLNYFFWPLILFAIIKILFWIQRGFRQ